MNRKKRMKKKKEKKRKKKTCREKKKRKKEKERTKAWEMKLSEIWCRKRTKKLAKHIVVRDFLFLFYFNNKLECSLIIIATFSENVAINKRYAIKTVLVVAF